MHIFEEYAPATLLVCFLVVACFFAAISARAYYLEARYEKDGIVAMGTVIEIKVEQGFNRRRPVNRHPIVRFTAQDGKTYRIKMASSDQYSRGQTVEILYPAEKPEKAIIKGSNAFGLARFGGILAAIIFLHVAAYQGYRIYRDARNRLRQ